MAQRGFVKDWKVEDLLADLDQVAKGRSFQKGKEAFARRAMRHLPSV